MREPLDAGKGQRADSALEPPEGISQHLDCSHETLQRSSLQDRI